MKLFHWSNQMVGDMDPEFANNDAISASVELITYGMQMAAERSANPGEDLVTKLVQADVDGHKLSDDEFGFFVILLAVAGNETTRNSITQGMMAFTDFPDQWELFKRDRPGTAADEIVRWATPVTSFQRTALVDTELAGVPIKKGQRVVMFYRSANFDEEVFEEPLRFNILRDPNPPCRLRRDRRPLLYRGGQSGPDDDRSDVQRHRRRNARPDLAGEAGTVTFGLAQRHQTLAGRLLGGQPSRRCVPERQRSNTAGSVVEMSSSMRSTTTSGASTCAKCPTSGRISSRQSGLACNAE